MNRLITFCLLLACCAISVFAGDITPEEAKAKATEFLLSRPSVAGGRMTSPSKIIAQQMTVRKASASIYAVCPESGGFVLVSKNDAVDDILGYCDEGVFSEESMPDNFRALMQSYESELSRMTSGSDMLMQSPWKISHKAIAPMLKSKWNQGEVSTTGDVFNCQCPTYNNYYCVTGCVAVAMAQVMYYHRYPSSTKQAIPSYTSNTSIGSLPSLPVTTIEWGSMLDEYTGTNLSDVNSYRAKAISKLLKYCGYAAKMSYGTVSSSAYTSNMLNGLISYFGYNPYAYIADRGNYTIVEWDALIYNELAAGRPVLYAGSSTGSGHQFVVDGADTSGKYHVNWGWGGRYDGYYTLNVLNPRATNEAGSSRTPDGYTMDHAAVIGLQPSKTSQLTGMTVTNVSQGNSAVSFSIYNKTGINGYYYVGSGVVDSNGKVTKLISSYNNGYDIAPDYGFKDYSVDYTRITNKVSAGTYKLCAVYSTDGMNWKPCEGSNMRYATVTVSGGMVRSCTIHPQTPSLSVTGARLTGNGYVNVMQEVEVTFQNKNADEYNGTIGMYLSNGSNLTTLAGVFLPASGSDKAYFYFTPTTTGTITLYLYETEYDRSTKSYILKTYIGKITVNVTQGVNGVISAKVSCDDATKIGGVHYIYYKSSTRLDITLENNTRNTTTGYLFIQRTDQNTYSYWRPNVSPYGKDVYSYTAENLTSGKSYTYEVYYNEKSTSLTGARLLDTFKLTVYNNSVLIPGDVNRDGKVDISDVVAVINTMAGDTKYKATADVNKDKKIDISDVVAVINIMAM